MGDFPPKDYSKYTLSELEDIHGHIDREKYPERFAAVEVALHQRRINPQVEPQTEEATWVKTCDRKRVAYKSRAFRLVLLTCVLIWFMVSILSLMLGRLYSIIDIFFCAFILFTVRQKSPVSIKTIRAYGILLFMSNLWFVTDLLRGRDGAFMFDRIEPEVRFLAALHLGVAITAAAIAIMNDKMVTAERIEGSDERVAA